MTAPASRHLASPRRAGGATRCDEAAAGNAALGLPPHIHACLFDLDGVLTHTAILHAAAWKQAFDGLLRAKADAGGDPFVPFDALHDYERYVDGKTRADGMRSFLGARHISLPEGHAGGGADDYSLAGLGRAKNAFFLRELRDCGVQAYSGSVRYVQAVASAALARAVVSSSRNCAAVLVAAGIDRLFDIRIDGNTVQSDHLAGKPAPDTFLAAADALGVAPGRAAVFEDALSGVEAGRHGGFGYVVGVDRVGQAEALRQHGADIVVTDLEELLVRA